MSDTNKTKEALEALIGEKRVKDFLTEHTVLNLDNPEYWKHVSEQSAKDIKNLNVMVSDSAGFISVDVYPDDDVDVDKRFKLKELLFEFKEYSDEKGRASMIKTLSEVIKHLETD
jgi:hypothetical protein